LIRWCHYHYAMPLVDITIISILMINSFDIVFASHSFHAISHYWFFIFSLRLFSQRLAIGWYCFSLLAAD
jgi:hypothetical protein